MGRLDGRVAIITGAGSGQGAAEARLFAREGARVVVTDLDEAAAGNVANEIGESAFAIRHDVSDEKSWSAVVAETLRRSDRIDILVNSAGIYAQGRFQDTDAAMLDRFYRINVLGTFLGMRSVGDAMLRQGGGAIVNVSSGAALITFKNTFAYSASKWMVRGMSKCAAVDLASEGIRVNTIFPGAIDTPMLAVNPPEYLETLKSMIPAGRLGTAEDIAEVALFLASDAASYLYGAEISVCGGAAA